MIKVDTVEQFKILQFIKANFELSCITIEKVCRDTLSITDRNNDSMNFKWSSEQNRVIWLER